MKINLLSDGSGSLKFRMPKAPQPRGLMGRFSSDDGTAVRVLLRRDSNGNGRLDSTDRKVKVRFAGDGEGGIVSGLMQGGNKVWFLQLKGGKNSTLRFTGEVKDIFTNTTKTNTVVNTVVQVVNVNVPVEVLVPVVQVITVPVAPAPVEPPSILPAAPIQKQTMNVDILGIRQDAAYENTLFAYQITTSTGGVRDPITNQIVEPGQTGYKEIALRLSQTQGKGFVLTGTQNTSFEVEPGVYAAGLISNGAENLPGQPNVFFEYYQANAGGNVHTRKQFGRLGFEDSFLGPNLDFDDFVVSFNPQPVATVI